MNLKIHTVSDKNILASTQFWSPVKPEEIEQKSKEPRSSKKEVKMDEEKWRVPRLSKHLIPSQLPYRFLRKEIGIVSLHKS